MTRPAPTHRVPAARARRASRPRLDPLECRLLLTAGDPDPTFGVGGLVTTAFSTTGKRPAPLGAYAYAVAMQVVNGQEKIVVAGLVGAGSFGLTRYNLNGTLDTGFGNGGIVTTSSFSGGNLGSPADMTIQPDGKILMVGTWNTKQGRTTNSDFATVRYNANGTLDTTFGPNSTGLVTTDLGSNPGYAAEEPKAVLLHPDGKILVVGNWLASSTDGAVGLVRYNPNGTVDSSFGEGGIVRTGISPDVGFDGLHDAALQPDGKIVAVGFDETLFGGTRTPALTRFNSDGSLDTTFGNAGRTVTQFSTGTGYGHARCVVIQPDGKIVAGVWGGFGDFALARYDTAGNLDLTFGQGGLATSNRPGLDGVEDLILQPDGKIVAAGFVGSSFEDTNSYDMAVARFNADGSLDGGFGNAGFTVRAFTTYEDRAVAVTLQSNGTIVTAGTAYATSSSDNGSFALARFLGDPPRFSPPRPPQLPPVSRSPRGRPGPSWPRPSPTGGPSAPTPPAWAASTWSSPTSAALGSARHPARPSPWTTTRPAGAGTWAARRAGGARPCPAGWACSRRWPMRSATCSATSTSREA